MLGKIDWFGGFNNNKNRVNDFGFITPLEGDNPEGIYLHRNDVPSDLEAIIEGQQGEGVYVQFEIDSTRNRAINLNLATFIGAINKLEKGSWQIKYDDNFEIVFKSINSFQNRDIVSFSIKEIRDTKFPITLKRLENVNEIEDEEKITKYAYSRIFSICKKFIAKYLSSLPLIVAETVLIERLDDFNQNDQDELIDEISRQLPSLILSSSKLRYYLKLNPYSANSYGNFINQYLNQVEESLQKELIGELIQRIEGANDEERNIYWQQVKYLQDNLGYQNFLWDIAPIANKIQCIAEYSLDSPEDVAEDVVLENFEYFSEQQKNDLINKLIQTAPNVILASAKLRSYLKLHPDSANSYGTFIDQYIYQVEPSLQEELRKELFYKLKILNDDEISIYWHQVKYLQENLAYKNFLWDIAPRERKIKIIRQHFKKLLDIISSFQDSSYPYQRDISHNRRELHNLNDKEKQLIRKWDSNVNFNQFKAEQMTSARGAEKLVIQFYEKLGYQVEDISIHQVTQESQEWIKGDIRLNSTELLDVKNSRKSNNSNSYSEFCVPSFKESRGHDVKIVGVLSPYLRNDVDDPKILGSFDKTQLTELERIFSDRLISIDMSRDTDINKYLPPWLFDYDEQFYKEQYRILTELQKLDDQDIPSWEDISSVSQNFLPVFIAAKRPLPQSWVVNLPKWQVEFIKGLIEFPRPRITLPYLFLSILRHFLSMLSYQGSDYNTQKYLEIICTTSSISNPLKLYDPLNIIQDFCGTLQTLWDNREKAKLTEFKSFKFSGRGVLQGKRSESDHLTTILAYCGGTIRDQGKYKGKCGFRPLVIAQHQNCPNCGRLICPKCDYCSDRCFKG